MKNKYGKIMTHIVAGYPSLKASEQIAKAMAKNGVDFIEIQIPFSDPVADGAVIMAANERALRNGIKVEDCFDLMRRLKVKAAEKPQFLFMSYFNILHSYGVEKFCKKAQEVGCYGLIVPDMPIEEEKYDKYLENCERYGLMAIQVISPLTPESRLKKIAKHARGFVYCVSRYGTTGATSKLNPRLQNYIKKVKKYISLPLAVGFGVSSAEHVKAVHREVEIAVIGSKIINLINSNKNFGLEEIAGFLNSLKNP